MWQNKQNSANMNMQMQAQDDYKQYIVFSATNHVSHNRRHCHSHLPSQPQALTNMATVDFRCLCKLNWL